MKNKNRIIKSSLSVRIPEYLVQCLYKDSLPYSTITHVLIQILQKHYRTDDLVAPRTPAVPSLPAEDGIDDEYGDIVDKD